MRYIHRWHTPIVVIVHTVPEYWYYAPMYNPRLLPVPIKVGNGSYPVSS
jgi:hypothetical protein